MPKPQEERQAQAQPDQLSDMWLVHVCKNKKCHTLVEDDHKLYCILCNADREDKKVVAAKGAAFGGAGLIGAGIKYRHAIKDVIVTLIKR